MKKTFLAILFLIFVATAFGQSGRIKPTPEESPAKNRDRIIYVPTQLPNPKAKPKPTPTPTPTAKPADEDDGEVIRVESALVPIPVSVTDAQGRAITTLKLEDFTLEIDGKPAEISELSRSTMAPVRLALLFDNSSSVRVAREFEKKAAIRFFRQVIRPEKDLVALFSVASTTELEQPLTKDISSLVRAIELFAEPAGGTQLLEGVIQAAEYLQAAEGRRVIVIMSDGEDNLSDSTLEQTVRAAQLNNCQIYVVKTTEFENVKRTGERIGNANVIFLAAERRMQELARQTGGAVYSPVDEDELDAAFTRISAELSQQYILSYYPAGDEKDKRGEFRTISLKIKNRENLTVRTRKGYYVPKR
ncbi:MAG TPA: VWA domain-containing protein [Pyrinomonadaceae bacterium]|jgi:Ca-activated chloride channel family protein